MELALWSFHFAKKLDPGLLDESHGEPIETRGKKRANKERDDKNSTNSDGDQDSPSQTTKKRKQ